MSAICLIVHRSLDELSNRDNHLCIELCLSSAFLLNISDSSPWTPFCWHRGVLSTSGAVIWNGFVDFCVVTAVLHHPEPSCANVDRIFRGGVLGSRMWVLLDGSAAACSCLQCQKLLPYQELPELFSHLAIGEAKYISLWSFIWPGFRIGISTFQKMNMVNIFSGCVRLWQPDVVAWALLVLSCQDLKL